MHWQKSVFLCLNSSFDVSRSTQPQKAHYYGSIALHQRADTYRTPGRGLCTCGYLCKIPTLNGKWCRLYLRKWRTWIKGGIYTLGAIPSVSRLWEGKHWLSDIVFSVAVSFFIVESIDRYLDTKYDEKYNDRSKKLSWNLNFGPRGMGITARFWYKSWGWPPYRHRNWHWFAKMASGVTSTNRETM